MKRLLVVFVFIGLAIGLMAINDFATEKKQNFRIKPLWQSTTVLYQTNFNPDLYEVLITWNLGDWFGKCWWYSFSDEDGYVGTNTQLYYQAGDNAFLHQMRRVSGNKVNRNLGIEAEVRLWKDLWFGGNYLQSPVFTIDTVEEEKLVKFLFFEKIRELPEYGYYEYYFIPRKYNTIQVTNERLSTNNFQIYGKYEIGTDLIQVFGGVGLDFWQLKRTVEVDRTIYGLGVQSDRQVSFDQKNTKQFDTKWYTRPFALIGLQIRAIKNLSLGAEAKIYKAKSFRYQRPFMLELTERYPCDDSSYGFWTFDLNASSLSLYLSFSF